MWNFDIGGSTGYDPVVVGGVVYACASGGSLYALNASSGKQLWNFPISGDLAVADGVIYISSGPTFSNGRLLSSDSYIVALGVPSAPSPSTSPTPTSTPSPSVPEFPTWIALPIFTVAVVGLATANMRRNGKGALNT